MFVDSLNPLIDLSLRDFVPHSIQKFFLVNFQLYKMMHKMELPFTRRVCIFTGACSYRAMCFEDEPTKLSACEKGHRLQDLVKMYNAHFTWFLQREKVLRRNFAAFSDEVLAASEKTIMHPDNTTLIEQDSKAAVAMSQNHIATAT